MKLLIALLLAASLSAQTYDTPGITAGGGTTTYSDTYANLSTTASSPSSGDLYFPTDSVYDVLRYNGSSWDHFVQGTKVAPPAVSDFSWINQGTSTAVETYGGITMNPAAATGWNMRMLNRDAPSTPYSIEVGVVVTTASGTSLTTRAGLYVRDGTGGDFVTMETLGHADPDANQINSSNMSSPTSAFGNNAQNDYGRNPGGGFPMYMRIRDNGTTRYFEISYNLRDWYEVHNEVNTDFTATDDVGIFVNNDAGTYDWTAHFFHYREN